MTVCVDASVAVKLVTREPDSHKAHEWFRVHNAGLMTAPAFMPVEVASAFRRKVLRQLLTEQQALEAIKLLAQLDIRLSWDWSLTARALTLAAELQQPTIYDTAYLALAERERCGLVTADAAFARACEARFAFVRVL